MSKKSNNNKVESYSDIKKKAQKLETTLLKLSDELKVSNLYDRINFDDFLYMASTNPKTVFRDIFRFFFDMINFYVPEGKDDYKESQHTIGFFDYDFKKLFVEDCDDPFFADRLFANRFINLVNTFSSGAQSNKIILFEGPPGSGKSTFLNNLLEKIENYSILPEGVMYKTYWRLNVNSIQKKSKLLSIIDPHITSGEDEDSDTSKFIEITCPSNDHPILQIPKKYRRKLLEELIEDKKIKEIIFNSKEYEWIFKDDPCHICSSIYNTLMGQFGDPMQVLKMIYAKRVTYSRQFGKGISVFNPGDELYIKPISDITVQNLINSVFQNERIKYLYSNLAYTNNGIYALMDIKENNVQRLTGLHGIISDGIHKVEHVEESIKSIFLGLVNPEDKKNYVTVKSFQDRILHVNIPYILDYEAEANVYRNKFGDIDDQFLPGVLDNFAKIVISSRMKSDSPTINNWIKDKQKYAKYNDTNLLILKMQLYKGIVPDWLSDEDMKNFTKDIRKALLAESETEGLSGISGRNSIGIFNKLMSKYDNPDKLITMENIKQFFKEDDILFHHIPRGLMKSLEDMYDFVVLQQIKESIFYFNKSQIEKEILNYIFALNYDIGNTEINFYTSEKLEITEDLYKDFEATILGTDAGTAKMEEFRRDAQKEYITATLADEIKLQGIEITKTKQFDKLFDKYTRSIKENALSPYIANDNFKRAINDFDDASFSNYPSKLKSDVTRLLKNLMKKYEYSTIGAKQVSLYAIEKKIWGKFGK